MDWQGIREGYKELKREKQAEGADRRLEILELRTKGYQVEELTETHLRVNGCLDLFPVRQKYHHIGLNKRGSWITALGVAERFLRDRR